MTLTVGTDTYLTLSDAQVYFTGRLYLGAWAAASDEDREKALRMACRAIDREDYKGTLSTVTQTLAWPRAGVVDKDGREIAITAVPQAIRDAQCEAALAFLVDDPNADDGTAGVRSVTAGSVHVAYDGRAPVRRLPDAVLRLLKKFLAPNAGSASALLVP